MVICTASRKVPRTVASQYWPGNCCYKRTLPMEDSLPNYLLSPNNKLSTCPLRSEWSSHSTHQTAGGRLNSYELSAQSLLKDASEVGSKLGISILHNQNWHPMQSDYLTNKQLCKPENGSSSLEQVKMKSLCQLVHNNPNAIETCLHPR